MMNMFGNINSFSYLYTMKQYKDTPYYITEDGKVWSSITEKYLKPYINKKGYVYHTLGRGNVNVLHRLVAETYLPNPNQLPEVDHKDTNKTNNHVSNLEWVTHDVNMKRAKENGLLGKNQDPKGSKNGNAVLTEDVVRTIRQMYSTKSYSQVELSEMFGVNQRSISNIVLRKSWRHI